MSAAADRNLYQRDGVYWARVKVAGRDIRRSLHTTVKKEARDRLKTLLGQAEAVRAAAFLPEAEAKPSWQDAVLRWSDLHLHELKPSSQTRYLVSLRQLGKHMDGREVGAIEGTDFNDFAVARMRGGTSTSTVRRDLSVASRVMKVAKRAGWIKVNPVPDEKSEIKERQTKIRPVPIRHIVAVIRAARTAFTKNDEPGLANLIRFCARVGCRQEEGASLEVSQFNPRERTITFPETKSGAPRVITISPRTAAWLAVLPKPPVAPDGQRYFFRDLSGNRLNQPAQRFQRAHRRAGVPHFRFHDMRHTYAIRRLQADERTNRTDNQPRGIWALSRHLGHASTKTTEIYLSWLKNPSACDVAQKGAQ